MEVIQKFRGALNGFHRKDVLNYIEASEQNHRAQLAELEKRLKAAEEDRDGLENSLTELRSESGSVAAEEAKVRASLEESTRTLSRVRGELSQAESKLAVAKNELARLQEQVAQMEPLAKSYEELKDRVATVELDAHKKAQATVDEARTEAENIRRETRQWLSGVIGQYDRLRQAMDEQMNAISRMSDSIRESGEAADRIREWGGLE